MERKVTDAHLEKQKDKEQFLQRESISIIKQHPIIFIKDTFNGAMATLTEAGTEDFRKLLNSNNRLLNIFIYYFEKLEVWQNARIFVKNIYTITSNFPDSEKFGITTSFWLSTICILLEAGMIYHNRNYLK